MRLTNLAVPMLFSAVGFAQAVISDVRIDDVGHSSLRATWNVSDWPSNQKIEWGPTASYGRVYYAYQPNYGKTGNQLLLSGLSTASDFDGTRTVHIRVCSNAGGWVCSADQAVKLLPLPASHPAEAILPETFQIAQPSTSGCTVRNIASDLSDLQTQVNAAVAAQPTKCQVLNLAPGTVGNVRLVIPPAADADRVPVANVNATTNTITPSTTVNTYRNGLRVRVAGDSWNGDGAPSGLTEGQDYCVTNYSAGTFTLAQWPSCGATVSLNTVGGGSWYIMPFPPPHSNYITIRSTASSLPPDGVRNDPQWKRSDSPKWYPPALGLSPLNYSMIFRAFAHHFYIGPGVNFTVPVSSQSDTTDPKPYMGWIRTAVSNAYIAIQRNWFDGGGYPERIYFPLNPEGSYIDFSDNYQEHIDYWRPVRTNLGLTRTSVSVATVAAGKFNTGIGNCSSIASSTAAISGTASGTAYFTVRPSDCAVMVTSTASVTCSGCTTAAGSDWPRNRDGRFAQGLIGSCTYSAGVWVECTAKSQGEFSAESQEGTAAHIVSYGPGPARIANNYEESHEIFWHLDSSAGNALMARDFVFRRNVFATPDKYRYGSEANNGLRYENRNQWECKRCERVLLVGNEFYGNFQAVNSGPAILINANAGGGTTATDSTAGDITIESNVIHDSAGGMLLGGGPPDAGRIPKLGRRMTVKNNLLYNMNGWKYYDASSRSSGWGYCFAFTHGGEDVILDHNTCYSAGGAFSVGFVVVSKMIEGFRFTNNALYFHQDANRHGFLIDWGSNGTGSPNCFGLTGKAGLDCWLNGNYTFTGNLLVGGYTNSQALTGDSNASNLLAAYAGLSGNFLPSQSSVAARLSSRRWISPATANFRFAQDSPHVSGGAARAADGRSVGIDQDALEDARGMVKNIRTTSITGSGATVSFHAPDAGAACYVGYGTAQAPDAWLRTAANTATSQERSIELTGLQAGTTYYAQVWCSGTTASPTQSFRTMPN